MSKNPFTKGTNSYVDFETMSDLKWHCSKCELLSGQAKTWQIWRQEIGLSLKQDSKKNYYKRIFCNNCNITTVHRGLVSLEVDTAGTRARSTMPTALRKRIIDYYGSTDAFTLRKETPNKLEVDHRFPQVRWTEAESENTINMSEDEIQEKFMLLTRENNLLKSRQCEKCAESNIRPGGYGINFWYEGNEEWTEDLKCKGCFWYDPQAWRDAVANILKEKEEK
ncbi:MAG TPA: hypothetical protein GX708_08700 [Gallicola sp.]|nr:hypothetical protein [Gallicola sp.]